MSDFSFSSLIKRFSMEGIGYEPIGDSFYSDTDEEKPQPTVSSRPNTNISNSSRGKAFLKTSLGALAFIAAVVLVALHHNNQQGYPHHGVKHPTVRANPSDFIPTVPLFGTPPSPQWSGLLNASASTPGTYLHYWFAHYDEGDGGGQRPRLSTDASIPLIVWFNGGPGSSSLIGFLTELGPFVLMSQGKGLLQNPYSWTKLGHLLALESPAGVGYSYCGNWTLDSKEPCINTDKTTAKDAYAALQDFLTTKFPRLRNNPLYITGESYAGVYVPTLAKEILDGNDKEELKSGELPSTTKANGKHIPSSSSNVIHLEGIAVGDPCTDNKAQAQGFDMIWYSHKYGLITDDLYNTLKDTCGLVTPALATRGAYYSDRTKNAQVLRDLQSKVLQKHHDHLAAKQQSQRRRSLMEEDGYYNDDDGGFGANLTDHCRLAYRKFLLSSSMGVSQGFPNKFINPYALYEKVDRTYDAALAQYMNRPDVQQMMHVNLKVTPVWRDGVDDSDADTPWEYHSSYDACNDQPVPNGTWSMIDFYRNLAPRLKRTVVYNGDSDPCVTYEGTRVAIEQVGFPLLPGGDYRPWFYNAKATSIDVVVNRPLDWGSMLSAQEGGPQFGGSVLDYEHNLSFASIHGSGHMVPENRPQATLDFLRRVLKGERLSPLLTASDRQIEDMNATEFEAFVSNWTQQARNLALAKRLDETTLASSSIWNRHGGGQ